MRKFPIPMPMMPHNPRAQGTRADRKGYLRPLKETWVPPVGFQRRSIAAIAALVLWLNVAIVLRWQPDGKKTYCDHFAADFLWQLLGRQVISAWIFWTATTAKQIAETGVIPPVKYNVNVKEHGARSLHAWLQEHGEAFGWREEKSESGLRNVLNSELTVGLITTDGHVAVGLPDDCGKWLGVPDGPNILQCQSGSFTTNGRRKNWWGNEPVKFWSFQGEWPS